MALGVLASSTPLLQEHQPPGPTSCPSCRNPSQELEFMKMVFLGLSDLLESRSIGGCFPLHLQLIAQPLWLLGCPPPMPPQQCTFIPTAHLRTHPSCPAPQELLNCSLAKSDAQNSLLPCGLGMWASGTGPLCHPPLVDYDPQRLAPFQRLLVSETKIIPFLFLPPRNRSARLACNTSLGMFCIQAHKT